MNEYVVTTSWDDGAIEDMQLIALLEKYRIPATFYISPKNSERKILKNSEIKQIAKKFEIGAHSLHHFDLTSLSEDQATEEITKSKQKLEQMIGEKVTSFCYPKGKINQTIKQLVGSAGFQYARTVQLFGTSVEDILLAPTTVHAYPHNPLAYIKHGTDRKLFYHLLKTETKFDWEILAKRSLDWCIAKKKIYHLWGHSWEIAEKREWGKLE